jgi:hypothetical protein
MLSELNETLNQRGSMLRAANRGAKNADEYPRYD